MCFVPRKKLNQIEAQIQELTKIVKTQELERLRHIRDMYNNQSNLVKDVKFRVKSVRTVLSETTGLPCVQVKYELPIINIELDDKGEPIKNDFFYAVNYLELISLEDMKLIMEEIANAQQLLEGHK